MDFEDSVNFLHRLIVFQGMCREETWVRPVRDDDRLEISKEPRVS